MTRRKPAARLPVGLERYRSTPQFTEASTPSALLVDHATKEGVWGIIRTVSGSLRYHVTDERRVGTIFELEEGVDGIVEPTIRHRVELVGDVRFQVDFYRKR